MLKNITRELSKSIHNTPMLINLAAMKLENEKVIWWDEKLDLSNDMKRYDELKRKEKSFKATIPFLKKPLS
jgi:ribonucleotide reductase beta subunit family protein with ferritin-like domain